MKTFFRRIHLWLSLAAGLVILICCLTGALLVFQKELEQAFNRSRYFVEQGKQRLSTDQLAKIVKEHNASSKINGIRIYTDPERSVEINISVPEKNESKDHIVTPKTSDAKRESRPPSLTVFIDPYTGLILDVYNPREGFFYQVMSLHRWLLGGSDSIGKTITGISTFIFLFILITGIILWWPKTKKIFVRRLKIKRSAGWKRFNHDLHIVLGFYSAIFLFIFAFTALAWSFEWFNNGIYAVTNSPQQPPAPPKSVYMPGVKTIAYEKAFEAARLVLKDAQYYNISKARDSVSAISVTSLGNNALHESATDVVYLDQYSGKLIGTMLFDERSLGSQVRSTFRPIHVGSIYGTPSKILAVIVCLFGASFPVTGTILWINRLKKKKIRTKPKVFATSAQEII